MVSLEQVGGLSFTKGCYPGQEIVARAQHRGEIKRSMVCAHVEHDSPPLPGDGIFEHGPDGQMAGRIVDAQRGSDGGVDLLAVVKVASAEGDLRLHDENGPPLHVIPLPYADNRLSGST